MSWIICTVYSSWFVVLCSGLILVDFIHTLHDYSTGTGTITWLPPERGSQPHRMWVNYSYKTTNICIVTSNCNKTKQNKTIFLFHGIYWTSSIGSQMTRGWQRFNGVVNGSRHPVNSWHTTLSEWYLLVIMNIHIVNFHIFHIFYFFFPQSNYMCVFLWWH